MNGLSVGPFIAYPMLHWDESEPPISTIEEMSSSMTFSFTRGLAITARRIGRPSMCDDDTMNLPLEMGQITEDNEFLCPFHDSKFCLKTGAVKKWVLSSAEWMPDEAKELTKAIKEIPLDLLPVMDKDDYIWLGLK